MSIKLKCHYCKNMYLVTPNRKEVSKYCSVVCRSTDKEYLKLLSNSQKGKPRPQTTGKLNGMWKEGKKGYEAVHVWVGKHFECLGCCEHCGISKDKVRLIWANVNHKYSTERSDWLRLCDKCHTSYDIKYNNKRMGKSYNNEKQRRCFVCHKIHPLTKEYFYPDKNRVYNFRYNCRSCSRQKAKENRKNSKFI